MEMAELKLKVPQSFIPFFHAEMPKTNRSILIQNAMLLYPYIKNDVISYGRAAEMLDIKKTKIIDLYSEMGLPLVSYDVSEIDADVNAIKKAINCAV